MIFNFVNIEWGVIIQTVCSKDGVNMREDKKNRNSGKVCFVMHF